MSYSMTVTVKDGKATVDEAMYLAPPDGKYQVAGHVPGEGTWQAENIQVTRFDEAGAVVIQASGSHHRIRL
jgi:hypothetical protein